jgi:hypothetical protein
MLDDAFPRTRPDGTPIHTVTPGPHPDDPYPLNEYKSKIPVAVLAQKLSMMFGLFRICSQTS